MPMRSGSRASSYNVLRPLSRSTTPNRWSGEKNTADAMSGVLPTCPTTAHVAKAPRRPNRDRIGPGSRRYSIARDALLISAVADAERIR